MKTSNRPTASNNPIELIAAMERQVRDLFNCEPAVGTLERGELFRSLAQLDVKLERLSLQSTVSEVELSGELAACSVELDNLTQQWRSPRPLESVQ